MAHEENRELAVRYCEILCDSILKKFKLEIDAIKRSVAMNCNMEMDISFELSSRTHPYQGGYSRPIAMEGIMNLSIQDIAYLKEMGIQI
jgi:hypothetical protein